MFDGSRDTTKVSSENINPHDFQPKEIRSTEIKEHYYCSLDRPLQLLVCMLHLNELPLKHVFEFFDGMTYGPTH